MNLRKTTVAFALLMILVSSCSHSKRIARKSNQPTSAERVVGQANVQRKYAQILGVSDQEIMNIPLYQFVDRWYGVPYKFGGTTTNGIDCSGFTGALYKEVYGKSLPRSTVLIEQQATRVSGKTLEEGNLLFFDIEGKKNAHIGVYLQNGKFVHASSSKGVIISELSNPFYKKAYAWAGKI